MKIIYAAIMLALSLSALANEISLIDQFFGKNGISNKKEVYAGEMLKYLDRPTLGESLPPSAKTEYRLIGNAGNFVVYAVLLTADGVSEDWYIYLINENKTWKIEAVRKLALPGLFYETLKETSGKKNRNTEEEYQYKNMLMVKKPDAELKIFLLANMEKFKKIISTAKTNISESNNLAKKLNLNYVNVSDETKSIDINIGGILDNSVGYLYVPDGEAPPSMSPANYIYIEKITENWFIYKTT